MTSIMASGSATPEASMGKATAKQLSRNAAVEAFHFISAETNGCCFYAGGRPVLLVSVDVLSRTEVNKGLASSSEEEEGREDEAKQEI
jgi:hypothetical protein